MKRGRELLDELKSKYPNQFYLLSKRGKAMTRRGGKRYRVCEHNNALYNCKICNDKSCDHVANKADCVKCKGKGICIHEKRKRDCKICNTEKFCECGKRRYVCAKHGGKGLCTEHGKQKNSCKECLK